MNSIQIPITLYSVPQALTFLESLELKRSDTWLRNRMRDEKLVIYRVGKSDFVTETDLYKLSRLPKPRPGPKQKGQGKK
jgi:hypothetical protein